MNSSGQAELWDALSEFFLDSEPNVEYVARVCAASSLSIEALERILHDEVAPVCYQNLLNPAGEWAGFNREKLAGAIGKYLNDSNALTRSAPRLVYTLLLKRSVKKYWMPAADLIAEYRRDI